MKIKTPYYLIDEKKLLKNLKKIKYVRDRSGARSVLALKCFSTWAVFGLMKKYLDGTTSSSLYEARLGHEKFGKEVHAYCVGYSPEDISFLKKISSKIIFNSLSQLKSFYPQVRRCNLGLRVNPQVSYSDFDLADPARRYSRLGAHDYAALEKAAGLIKGLMFHCNCENEDFDAFAAYVDTISKKYGNLLKRLEWVSLGGGIYFTKDNYPIDAFCRTLKEFSKKFNVQVYLEPGETVVTGAGYLVTRVVDIVHHEIDIAIVDSSIEAHMLDLLVYRTSAQMEEPPHKKYEYMVAGRSCLAGDIFGKFNFKSKLKIGSIIHIADAAGYTMVKKNWFNGVAMPSIVIKKCSGAYRVIKNFSYNDYKNSLS